MSPITAFVLVAAIFAIGDIVSTKSKAFIPSVFVAAVLFLAGYWTFFPKNIIDIPGLGMPLALMSMYMLLTHMGTMMSVRELLAQWKTVAIALFGLVGMCALTLTAGAALFGRQAAIAATPPLAGGIVAALMMSEAAKAKGLMAISVLALVMYVMQGFAGYPLTAVCLRKEGQRLLDLYHHHGGKEQARANAQTAATSKNDARWRIFPATPPEYQTTFVLLAKLAVVAWVAVWAAGLTKNAVSPFVVCLLAGVAAAETGFIERRPLNLSGSFGWLMLSLMAYVFTGFSQATPAMLGQIVVPLVGIIILGVAGMALFSMFLGTRLGFTKEMALAVTLTALYGFPPNYILTEEAAKALAETPEEKEFLMNEMLPQMLVGGFTTVTIASVVLAGFMAKWL
ncbi:MAG TPA: hypothetical protein GXX50_11905 [Firmicutes bacterium]|uniref:hypothetical protein n=1 Tax=Gelria sp. Kuro-4 TaxID=2796927 RepID=UPI00199D844B|nr:hypothetical protein [Gelria sp. Kuro-4]MDI3523080.1 hypothetical protein [Bacillota bacterium]MDK2926517.1 hypothetical protein [Bacillota bacterium]BCV25675.1 membrane protein [Gelria sp. Kuro-4]HHV58439.1 hypothetical protein [Bacillota bacterium]